MLNNFIKFIIKQNSLNSNEQVTSVLNLKSKPNLNLNNGKEMKNRKEKRRGEGLGSPGSSAQSAPARAAQLTAQQRLRAPHLRSLPLDPACQPHDATPARLPASACSRCRWTPQVSPTILLLHAMHDHRATEPRQQWQGGPGGHA